MGVRRFIQAFMALSTISPLSLHRRLAAAKWDVPLQGCRCRTPRSQPAPTDHVRLRFGRWAFCRRGFLSDVGESRFGSRFCDTRSHDGASVLIFFLAFVVGVPIMSYGVCK